MSIRPNTNPEDNLAIDEQLKEEITATSDAGIYQEPDVHTNDEHSSDEHSFDGPIIDDLSKLDSFGRPISRRRRVAGTLHQKTVQDRSTLHIKALLTSHQGGDGGEHDGESEHQHERCHHHYNYQIDPTELAAIKDQIIMNSNPTPQLIEVKGILANIFATIEAKKEVAIETVQDSNDSAFISAGTSPKLQLSTGKEL